MEVRVLSGALGKPRDAGLFCVRPDHRRPYGAIRRRAPIARLDGLSHACRLSDERDQALNDVLGHAAEHDCNLTGRLARQGLGGAATRAPWRSADLHVPSAGLADLRTWVEWRQRVEGGQLGRRTSKSHRIAVSGSRAATFGDRSSSRRKTRIAFSRRNFGQTWSRNGTSGSSRKIRSSDSPDG